MPSRTLLHFQGWTASGYHMGRKRGDRHFLVPTTREFFLTVTGAVYRYDILIDSPVFYHYERSGIMQKGKKVKFTTNIDEELLKKIKVRAIEEGQNVNEIIEKLFQEYLKR